MSSLEMLYERIDAEAEAYFWEQLAEWDEFVQLEISYVEEDDEA